MDIGIVYRRMFDALKSGGVEAVISAAYDIFKMPIAVTDASFTMLVPNHPPLPQGDDYWDRPLQEMKVPLDVVQAFQEHHVIERVCENPDNPVYLNWGPFEKSPRITTVVRVNDVVEGYIAVLCPRDGFEPWWQLKALTIVADSVGMALQKEQNIIRESNVLTESFARDLILGVIKTPEEQEKWMKITGLSVKPQFWMVAIEARSRKQAVLKSYIQDQLRYKRLPILMYPYADALCVLVYNQSDPAGSPVLEDIFSLAESLHAICGVSRPFDRLDKTGVYRDQALLALSVLRRMGYGGRPVFYGDCSLTAMLLLLHDGMAKESCIHPAIGELSGYDGRCNTDYLSTLRAYLFSGHDTAAACEELHIHRNTMLYRLNKIRELTGLDLRCGRTNAELLLGIHLVELRKSLGGEGK